MSKCVKRFTHKKLFVDGFKQDMALASFTNGVRHKGLREKFIIEQSATLEKALKVANIEWEDEKRIAIFFR